MPAIFGGAIVTEQIFRIPGIGSLLISSILANDTPVVMAVTFVFACLVVLFNLIADILYGWLDPRITLHSGSRRRARERAPLLAWARGLAAVQSAPPGARRWRHPDRHGACHLGWDDALAGAHQRYRFYGSPRATVVAASLRDRRSRPGSAGAHDLWRAHLAGRRAGSHVRGGERRNDCRRHRRHVTRLGGLGPDVAHRPLSVAAAAAAAAARDLSLPRSSKGAARARGRRLC